METKKWGEVEGLEDYETLETCRLCNSNQLTLLFSLGNLHLSTFVDKPEDSEKVRKVPLELVWCENCSLIQLRHTAPPEYMYTQHYWYRSALNQVIIDDLKEIGEVARDMVPLNEGDVLLDIGANDGTLLSFYPDRYVRVGCEPATNLLEELRTKCDKVIDDFWSYEKYLEVVGVKKAKIITAIGTFYDIENPNKYIRDVVKVLDKDGVFIAQLMATKQMLENNDIGNICHEHLEYYSYESLKYLFEKNGLEIFKVEENSINGGSYRLFARPYRTGSIDYKENITKQSYVELGKRMEVNKKACVEFIHKLNQEGKKVYGFGASTKGNTILQYYGLGPNDLKGVAEIHSGKFGKYTVGSNISIIEEEEAKKDADYFFILPYAFRENFITKNKKWLEEGGKFIFALPELEIYPPVKDENVEQIKNTKIESETGKKRALVLGVTGQDGSYLTELLIEKGYEVCGVDRDLSLEKIKNIEKIKDKIILHKGDLTNIPLLYKIISEFIPHEIYNMADLAHAGKSFDNPRDSYNTTGLAVGDLLEIIRNVNPKIKFFQPLSSHVFGRVDEFPQTEETPYRPQSPHACAKAFAHILCNYYRDVHKLFISTGFFYNHCSERSPEKFVTSKIIKSAVRIKKGLQKKLLLGDLSAQIDFGYAPEYMEATWKMMQLEKGRDFVICTGERHSVKEFLKEVFYQLDLKVEDYVEYDSQFSRPGKTSNLVGDYSKARTAFGFEPKVKFKELVRRLVDYELSKNTESNLSNEF
tara:strand:- start:21157 stop:23427 length:2271 start_codon:yes stop_codon:yes gene_type:complete